MTELANGATVEVNGAEIVIRIHAGAPLAAPTDRLIRLERRACETDGFELRGLQAKVRAGDLPVVKIGRASYVRLSDLCALAKPVPSKVATAPDVAYAELVNAPRRRRERRVAA